MNEYNKTEADSQIERKKQWLFVGRWGQDRGKGLGSTNYYV